MQKFMNILGKLLLTVVTLSAGLYLTVGFAAGSATDTSQGIAISSISDNIGTSVTALARILSDISLVAGIGFVMASLFKFHQHKLNPTQVPISQGVTLLMIGAGLVLFPYLVPTAKRAVFGTAAEISKVGGDNIANMIGGSGS